MTNNIRSILKEKKGKVTTAKKYDNLSTRKTHSNKMNGQGNTAMMLVLLLRRGRVQCSKPPSLSDREVRQHSITNSTLICNLHNLVSKVMSSES